MSNKTRSESIYVIYEGNRDGYFLEYIANHSNVRYNPKPCNGGNANTIITNAIKQSTLGIKIYVVFDEDFESRPRYNISDETLEGLSNRWKTDKNLKGIKYRCLQKMNENLIPPILIVSYPQSIEGFLLRLLGRSLQELDGKNTDQLKNELASFLDNTKLLNEDNEKIQYYNKKIKKYKDEISRLQQSEPVNKKHIINLKTKIENCGHDITKVIFLRFLNEKLPIKNIVKKRSEISELDTLLTAFGL